MSVTVLASWDKKNRKKWSGPTEKRGRHRKVGEGGRVGQIRRNGGKDGKWGRRERSLTYLGTIHPIPLSCF